LVVFSADDTFEILRCLEEVLQSHRGDAYLAALLGNRKMTEVERLQSVTNVRDQMMVLRLAAARNLARTMIVTSQ
jgi:hypothetical protein